MTKNHLRSPQTITQSETERWSIHWIRKDTIINMCFWINRPGCSTLFYLSLINRSAIFLPSTGSCLSSLTLTPVRWLQSAPRGPDVQPGRSQRPRVSSAGPWSQTERPSRSHASAAFPPYLQGETQRTCQLSLKKIIKKHETEIYQQ